MVFKRRKIYARLDKNLKLIMKSIGEITIKNSYLHITIATNGDPLTGLYFLMSFRSFCEGDTCVSEQTDKEEENFSKAKHTESCLQ